MAHPHSLARMLSGKSGSYYEERDGRDCASATGGATVLPVGTHCMLDAYCSPQTDLAHLTLVIVLKSS